MNFSSLGCKCKLNFKLQSFELTKFYCMWIVIFWIMTPCTNVGGYQCLREVTASQGTMMEAI
jgi:hypothetical protein